MELILNPYLEQVMNSYYADNAKKLCNLVDQVLYKLHFIDVDKEDFYSLANEVFCGVLRDYDSSQSFDGFLYTSLYKKFCTEMTSRTRDKRCTKVKVKEKDKNGEITLKIKVIPDERMDAPIGDKENSTLGEMLSNKITVESEIFDCSEEGYSKKMIQYLSRLSNLQKEILRFTIAGYTPKEIREELHITKEQYDDCNAAIHSYRNVSVLF